MMFRSGRIWLAAITLLTGLLVIDRRSPAADAKKTYPRTVLVIRHAEKPPGDDSVDLSAEGKKRAEALPKLFVKSDTRPDPFPTPDFIIATKNSKHSHRPVETVTPLSETLKLPINSTWADADYADVAKEIFGHQKYAGKVVLVCWHHGNIPALAGKLKATGYPPEWKGSIFDRVWQIGYDAEGKTTFSNLPQRLLPGDSKE